jgi:site-specific recombinase XerD
MQNLSLSLTTPPASLAWPVAERFPPDRHPMAVYLARLAPSSRRPMRAALEDAARILTSGQLTAAEVPWHHLARQHLMALRSELAQTYAPSTGNRILTAVRSVLQECWELGYMSSEDQRRASTIQPIRGQRLPKGRMLSPDELGRLFQVCAADPSPAGRRDAAMLAVLYGTGPRRSEVVNLDVSDYDSGTEALIVRAGKGNKDRLLLLNALCLQAVREWLTVRGQDPGPLFVPLSKRGRLLGRRLSDKAVTWILQARADQAGVAAFSPHDLRRTFISNLLDASVDLATVADMAGHGNISTTAKYDRRGDTAKRKAAALLAVPFVPMARAS